LLLTLLLLAQAPVLHAQTQVPAGASTALPAPLQAAMPQALALLAQAARAQAPATARLEIEVGRVDSRLRPAPCAQVEPHLLPGAPVWGRTRIGLRCLRGAVAWNVFVPVTVQVWAPALAASAPLPAGSTLQASQLSVQDVNWSAGPGAPLLDPAQAVGRILARPLMPGQALHGGDLQPRQWFAAGDTVDIVARGPGFAVASQGQALTAGLEGRPARVRTETGRIVSGQPVADRRLDLNL
jgi:flagellar basal body P-ring formation protein FlgA